MNCTRIAYHFNSIFAPEIKKIEDTKLEDLIELFKQNVNKVETLSESEEKAFSLPTLSILPVKSREDFTACFEKLINFPTLSKYSSISLKDSSFLCDEDLARLVNTKSIAETLEKLDLSNCPNITEQGFEHLTKLTKLKDLNVAFCKITDDSLQHLTKSVALTSLNLAGCSEITTSGFIYLSTIGASKSSEGLNLSSLKKLNLSFCNITNQALNYLKGTDLERLDLTWCSKITDEGLGYLKNSTLEYLDIANCSLITDRGLGYLKDSPLKHLDISLCLRITDAGLMSLEKSALTSLRSINSPGITSKTLSYLSKMPLKSLFMDVYTHS